MSRSSRIASILIAGGGIAGSLAAAVMRRSWGPDVAVTVVSPGARVDRTAVALSLPPLRALHDRLRIDEDHLIASIGGSFSLGGLYEGWREGELFFPFGETGRRIGTVALHQHWNKAWSKGLWRERFAAFSLATQAALGNKFARPPRDGANFLPSLAYGLHLPALAYADYLRALAARDGASFVTGKVAAVERRADDPGSIEAVRLEDGTSLSADLYLDCSGAARILAQGRDWQASPFAADRQIGLALRREGPLAPYARFTRFPGGWESRAPVAGGIGVRLVFDSRKADPAQRLDAVSGQMIGEPVEAPFDQGALSRPWEGNCIALGAAACCIEPLSGLPLLLIQGGISRLMALFPSRDFAGSEAGEFNRLMAADRSSAADLPAFLHEEHRRPALAHKLALFAARGTVAGYDDEILEDYHWINLLLAAGVKPESHDLFADLLSDEETVAQLAAQKEAAAKGAAAMPALDDFLASITGRR
jgi:tryptophan halogenase